MNKQEILDILNTIYIRFMRLQFSYKTFGHIFCAPTIINDYPNLCWCMKVSFATLAKDNEDVNVKYKEIMKKMDGIIPDIHGIRSQMFCHLVQKQTDNAIQTINAYCWEVLECFKELHAYCCRVYGIDESELNGYDNGTFIALGKELEEFNRLLMNGSMSAFNDMLTEIQAGKSFKDAKEIRHKHIKSEK